MAMRLLLLTLLALTASTSAGPSIYDQLQNLGLPAGIFPDRVESYTMVRIQTPMGSDRFRLNVYLKKPCYIKYGDLLVHFDKEITGMITDEDIYFTGGVNVILSGGSLHLWRIAVYGYTNKVVVIVVNEDGSFRNIEKSVEEFSEIQTCTDDYFAACGQSSKLISQPLQQNSSTSAMEETINDVLCYRFAIPPGILPDAVKSYSLAPDSSFVIYLDKPCYVNYRDLLIHFDAEITGKITFGQITQLKGLSAREPGGWFDIYEIKTLGVDNRPLLLKYGRFSVKFDVVPFMRIPNCTDKALATCGHDQSSKLISQPLQLPVTAA